MAASNTYFSQEFPGQQSGFDQSSVQRFAGRKFQDVAGLPEWLTNLGNTLRSGAAGVRDRVIVPGIDTLLGSGLINPQVGLFGRYLTGTNAPLTTLPPSVNAAIKQQSPNYQRERQDWRSPSDFDVVHRMGPRGDEGAAYQPWVPKDLQNTLGQFVVRPGPQGQPTVIDRYRFNNLTDATEGGPAAQWLIKKAAEMGLTGTESDLGRGYEIRAQLQ